MPNFHVGDLLVASSLVDSTVLHQSVCLLVYQDDENAIGVMLNRPMKAIAASKISGEQISGERDTEPSVPALPAPVASESADRPSMQTPPAIMAVNVSVPSESAGKLIQGTPLHFGGPLAGPVVAVHGSERWAEAEAGDGIFVAAQRDNLEGLMRQSGDPYRLIVGHLGWSQSQLHREFDEGIWHRVPATSDVLMTDDSQLWPRLIRRGTTNSVARWVGATDNPNASELN